jgi:cyclic pyranopterin monophosphate synthase
MTPHRNRKATARARLSHLDARGRARMVDVSAKAVTEREAVARGVVRMQPATLELIRSGKIAKGEVLAVARIAGIMAAKRTADLIPLCHPLPIQVAAIDFIVSGSAALEIEARVKVSGKTGVEMEALAAVSAAALTIYDMCKAVDRDMVITDIRLMEKRGGRSGEWQRVGDGGRGSAAGGRRKT